MTITVNGALKNHKVTSVKLLALGDGHETLDLFFVQASKEWRSVQRQANQILFSARLELCRGKGY
jgi:hypothetical protein